MLLSYLQNARGLGFRILKTIVNESFRRFLFLVLFIRLCCLKGFVDICYFSFCENSLGDIRIVEEVCLGGVCLVFG